MTFRHLIRVAAVLLAAGALPPALAADPTPEPVVIAAYNVENWLTMSRREDGEKSDLKPKPDAEKSAVVEVIAGIRPDILGITEIGAEADVADLQERLAKAGLDYPHREWLDADDPDRHVVLLSRFPIVSRNPQTGIRFDLGGQLHAMSRGILDVTVEINPTYRLRLIGVHLKSKREIPDYSQAEMRAREALHLKNYINGILAESPGTNLLLFGDLNETKNEYPIRQLLGKPGSPTALVDLQLADEVGDRWTHFWQWADIYSRIDYLIASPALVPEILADRNGIDRSPNWSQASDHRATFTAISPQDK